MLAVAAVLDVVQIVAGLLTEQPQALGTGHMKLLLAVRLIALHTGPNIGPVRLPNLKANITG